MPGATANLALPYPIPDDSVDVPRDVKALADKLDLSMGGGGVLKAAPVLDVGVTGQVRAGRQLTVADFTALGLAQPVGLWNLSDLSNLGSDGRALSNKGAVAFAPGINGLASTAAQFTGSTAQALYIADSGAADPLRIRTGSWGCWFRTAKRGAQQGLLTKYAASQQGWVLQIVGNTPTATLNAIGTGGDNSFGAVSDVADDRWHFVVVTVDATVGRIYVDGVPEGSNAFPAPLFASAAPLNIGAYGADSGNPAAIPFYGRVDEAFVTNDVLSEDQIRVLYAAKITHTLGVAPTGVRLTVNRRRKGAALTPADFTTTPIRLHNFTAGALTDEGSGGVALTNNGAAVSVAGADGSVTGGFSFAGAQSLSATDAGLPAALASRSYGCWLKTTSVTGAYGHAMAYGGTPGAQDVRIANVATTGTVMCNNGGDSIIGPFIADGQWHLVIATEDNAASDGVRRKLYLDGRIVGGSTVINPITLAGANRFRVGALSDGTQPFIGQTDGAFVTGYPLDAAEIARLYAKGSQGLGASPKNAGDHVERMDATAVYLIADTLETQHTIDLGVTS